MQQLKKVNTSNARPHDWSIRDKPSQRPTGLLGGAGIGEGSW
jgi:hypothetical protein